MWGLPSLSAEESTLGLFPGEELVLSLAAPTQSDATKVCL